MQLSPLPVLRDPPKRSVDPDYRGHVHHDRAAWQRRYRTMPLAPPATDPACHGDVAGLAAPLDIEEIYRPLTHLIGMRATAARTGGAGPFIVGVAGSVAVGKSRTAQLLQALLKSRPDRPSVDIVTTDGFIYPRAELVRRGLLGRKGFPESYDLRWLTQFLSDVRTSGCGAAPVYSHHAYDRIPGEHWVRNPDILIVEGVNVLQIEGASIPAGQAGNPFDLSIYLDADTDDIARWYEDRFLSQQNTAFRQPASPFHHLADASIEDARAAARELWTRINAINLVENILPTRPCADVILCKGPDHAVRHLWLRPLREVR